MNKRQSDIQTLWLSLSEAKSTHEYDKCFTAIFERLKAPLEHYFKVKCGKSTQDADDLILVTMERVLEKMHLYDESSGMFSTWVFTIARNALIDQVRKDRIKKASYSIDAPVATDDGEMAMDVFEEGTPLPDELLMAKQSYERLHKCIGTLQPEAQKVVVMFYFEQLKMVEICEKLSMHMANVKILLFRARKTLAEIY